MCLQLRASSIVLTLFLTATAHGQPAPNVQPAAPVPSAILQPTLSNVQSTTSALNISRWKAPGSVREASQQNIDSIQRDLGNTLPTLLAQADSAPDSVPPSFAVYRNLDALYDVLLRVSETANLAAPEEEADSLAASLQKLETARAALGDAILHASQRHEAQIVALQTEIKTVRATPPPQKREIIVDDGPAGTPARRVRKKTTSKKPAQKPAAGTPAATPSK
jgi:hypothetical protein